MLEDRLLLWRVRRGDKEALRAIYESHKGRLMGMAAGILGSNEAAEDVLHDVFVSFAERAVRLEEIGNLRAYLATCVVNRSRDRFRRKGGEVQLEAAAEVTGRGPEASESAARGEEIAKLREAIEELPAEQREVVMMRLHGEMRFAQIAKVQGAPAGTVRARYRYGLEKLRTIMNGEVTR